MHNCNFRYSDALLIFYLLPKNILHFDSTCCSLEPGCLQKEILMKWLPLRKNWSYLELFWTVFLAFRLNAGKYWPG